MYAYEVTDLKFVWQELILLWMVYCEKGRSKSKTFGFDSLQIDKGLF